MRRDGNRKKKNNGRKLPIFLEKLIYTFGKLCELLRKTQRWSKTDGKNAES